MKIEHKLNYVAYVSLDLSNVEINNNYVVAADDSNDNDQTIIMSNTTRHPTHRQQVGPQRVANAPTAGDFIRQEQDCIKTTSAIADTGATSIFIMEGVPMHNKRVAVHPLTINLPNGAKVRSIHECDVMYPGLPVTLTGHIAPGLTISSLIGIRVLCEAGCNVTFNKNYCHIIYKGVIIMRGHKDLTTDLWLLPIWDIIRMVHNVPLTRAVFPYQTALPHHMYTPRCSHTQSPREQTR